MSPLAAYIGEFVAKVLEWDDRARVQTSLDRDSLRLEIEVFLAGRRYVSGRLSSLADISLCNGPGALARSSARQQCDILAKVLNT